MRALPLPPRLARMLLRAAELGQAEAAAEIAAVLVERNLGGSDVDLAARLQSFRGDRTERARTARRLARRWAQEASADRLASPNPPANPAALLALAYPDRIAKSRGPGGQFLLANGRGARVDAADPLALSPYLVVAELAGAAAEAHILLAAALSEAEALDVAQQHIIESDEVSFDAPSAALRARRVRRIGAIVLASEPRRIPQDASSAAVLATGIARLGIERLPWTPGQLQVRHRVAFLRAAGRPEASAWPDFSDAALSQSVESWLAPFLVGHTRLGTISGDTLQAALDALLPRELRRRLDREAPSHFEAPTGRRHAIDYEGEGAPILAIRVQELFGLQQHPTIAAGRMPLTLHLLSPAGRPIQITRDLPGFWRGSWVEVKAAMRGRYPKHPWPDDPARAAPTARAKPRAR
jgi:ATP-dependent helicase HrpB